MIADDSNGDDVNDETSTTEETDDGTTVGEETNVADDSSDSSNGAMPVIFGILGVLVIVGCGVILFRPRSSMSKPSPPVTRQAAPSKSPVHSDEDDVESVAHSELSRGHHIRSNSVRSDRSTRSTYEKRYDNLSPEDALRRSQDPARRSRSQNRKSHTPHRSHASHTPVEETYDLRNYAPAHMKSKSRHSSPEVRSSHYRHHSQRSSSSSSSSSNGGSSSTNDYRIHKRGYQPKRRGGDKARESEIRSDLVKPQIATKRLPHPQFRPQNRQQFMENLPYDPYQMYKHRYRQGNEMILE